MMSRPLIRRLKPEEKEVLRKREELAAIRATLAERELELVDLRSQPKQKMRKSPESIPINHRVQTDPFSVFPRSSGCRIFPARTNESRSPSRRGYGFSLESEIGGHILLRPALVGSGKPRKEVVASLTTQEHDFIAGPKQHRAAWFMVQLLRIKFCQNSSSFHHGNNRTAIGVPQGTILIGVGDSISKIRT